MEPQEKPWTVIFPLNELYYLAEKERRTGHTLPIVALKSRKTQQVEHPHELSHKPWEKYVEHTTQSLQINYDKNNSDHEEFSLQDQAQRNKKRGLKATFIDELSLRMDGEHPEQHYVADFKIMRIPKESDTLKTVKEHVEMYDKTYHLYPGISKKDRAFYNRIFTNPSCLELYRVIYDSNPRLITRDRTMELLNGMTKFSQKWMSRLMRATKDIAWDVYKRYREQSGFVLDGVVSPDTIRRLFTSEMA